MKHIYMFFFCFFVVFTVNAQQEIIVNSSFEEDFFPAKTLGTDVYTAKTYAEPLRVVDYFIEYTQGTYPTMGTVPDYNIFMTNKGVWFLLNPTGWYYVRSYVDEYSDTAFGDKCMTLRHVGHSGSQDRADHAYTPFKYSVFQRLELDNEKQYQLKFNYKKRDLLPGPSGTFVENKTTRFVVGIISELEVGEREYSNYVDVDVPVFGDEAWREKVIIFDLPSILEDNPALDFFHAALFFGIQTQVGDPHPTSGFLSVQSTEINIDAVSLTEKDPSSVHIVDATPTYSIVDKKLLFKYPANTVKVYNLVGTILSDKSNLLPGSTAFSFSEPGVYIIYVDGLTRKVMEK